MKKDCREVLNSLFDLWLAPFRRPIGTDGRESVECLQSEIATLENRMRDLEEENREFNQLFELQHSRVTEAEAFWREDTGRFDIIPDLGTLVEWLIDRAKLRETRRT